MNDGTRGETTASLLTLSVDEQASATERALALPLPAAAEARPRGAVVVTGIGASQGPAHLLCLAASRRGLAARFEPFSAFAQVEPPRGDTLVVMSQGLCPNVSLALAARSGFARTLLVTSLDPTIDDDPGHAVKDLAAQGVVLVSTGAGREPDLLVRVSGPVAGSVTACRLASAWGDPPGASPLPSPAAGARAVREAVQRAGEAVARLPEGWSRADLSIVTFGENPALAQGPGWALLEGCLGHAPGVYDILSVAHGPFQNLFHREHTFFALSREGHAGDADLIERLRAMLVEGRHRVVALPSTLPRELGAVEHHAAINAVLAAAVRGRPDIDLRAWPGKGRDAPLYGLAARFEAKALPFASMQTSLAKGLFDDHVKPLAKRALKGFVVSVLLTLGVLVPVALLSIAIAQRSGQYWRGLLALLVTVLAFGIGGPALAVKRAVGDAVLFGLQTLRLGDRTTAMVFDRIGIHAVDRAGERGGAGVQKVERIPLAEAEKWLRDAVDQVLRVQDPAASGFFQKRIRQTLVTQIQRLTLSRFRAHDKELPGVDLRKVRVEVAERADEALQQAVGGALTKTTVMVLGLVSLGSLLVAYGIRSIP